MTAEPPVPFPISPYCQVRARVASIWADGPDDGTHPDWRPAVGEKITLTPSIGSQLLTYDATGDNPIIVTVERVECVVGDDGLLTKSDGRPVYIAPTDDPLLSVTGWTWTASIKGKTVRFAAPTGGVADLALFIAAPATDNTKTWIDRIPAFIENLVSIKSVTRDGDDMVVTLTNGSVNRFPMPEGPDGPEGPQGPQGDKGEPGDKGDKGDKGDPGEKGDKGEPGGKGGKGDKGDPGEKGDKGDPGEKGDKGDQGDPGEQGEPGAPGEQGDPGDKGDKGDPGEQGDKGDKGDKGDPGTTTWAGITDKPTIPDSPDDIGAAPATHDHTAADIDSGAATDGHVLTADGAGGAAWEAPPAGGGGSIDGLNVITGPWPPPLENWEYPEGTLYVRDPEESFGPVMAVRADSGWTALALDSVLSEGRIGPDPFTPGIGEMDGVAWRFGPGRSDGFMGVFVNSTPEPGDTLCTFDWNGLTNVQKYVLSSASVDQGEGMVLTGMVLSGDEPVGIHHLIVNLNERAIKYLWTVAGTPPASGDWIDAKWPLTMYSAHWEPPQGGGVVT